MAVRHTAAAVAPLLAVALAQALECWGPDAELGQFFAFADGLSNEECIRRGSDPNARGTLG